MDEDHVEFALEFWTNPELVDENNEVYNFTRQAESTSKVVRDPSDRKSVPHRIHWLEETIGVIYASMLKRGKQVFGEQFHMSWPYFLDLRPYYVKDATRETCMCVYHLRFDEMANGLLRYRRTLRRERVATCNCSIPQSSRDLRKQLVCAGDDGLDTMFHSLDAVDCIMQKCEDCMELRKLFNGPSSMCEQETRDPGGGSEALQVKFESYDKIKYTTKDGTDKDRKDFVSRQLPFSQFKSELMEYWPKFLAHHNDAKWHDDDFASIKARLRCGHVAAVIDFAENYSHQPRFEHQSKYFSQVQTTIVPVVLMFRIEDLLNVAHTEKEELIAMFDKLELPKVVFETHFIISSDMQHDNAFIQKGLNDHIIPYIKGAVPNAICLHVRSDGCKVCCVVVCARCPIVMFMLRYVVTGHLRTHKLLFVCRHNLSVHQISFGFQGRLWKVVV